MTKLTTHDKFLAHVNKLLKEHLASPTFNGLERLSVKLSVYDIFQESQDLEEIYYQLLDYMEKDRKLVPLSTKIEMYYSSLTSGK
jgi:hypothetical protein